MITRLPDWPERLAKVIAEANKKPFSWHQQNCGLLVTQCVMALTGVDISRRWRNCQSKRSVAALLQRENGLATLACKTAYEFGFSAINPRMALRGDICLVAIEQEEILGVCIGAKIACPGEQGLIFYPLAKAQQAWRI